MSLKNTFQKISSYLSLVLLAAFTLSSCNFNFKVAKENDGESICELFPTAPSCTGISVMPKSDAEILKKAAYMRIEGAAGGTSELDTHAMTADDSILLYVAAYNSNNTFLGNIAANWSVQNALGPISSTATSPGLFSANVVGVEVVDMTIGTFTDSTGNITISQGAQASIKINSAAGAGGIEINTNTITADQTDLLYASSYDADGNWIADVAAAWSFVNDKGSFDAGVDTVAASSSVTFNADVTTAAADHAVIQASFGGHTDDTGTVNAGIEITAGALASIRINSGVGAGGSELNTNTLTADQTDSLYSSSYDADGNWIASVNAAWSFVNDKGSFNAGVDTVGAASLVTFNADIVTMAANHCVIRASFGGKTDDTGTVNAGIQINYGVQAYVKIVDATGSGGIEKNTANVTADDNFTLYGASYDSDGNFRLNPTGNWSFTNDKGSYASGSDLNTKNGVNSATFYANQVTYAGDHAVLKYTSGGHSDDTGTVNAGIQIIPGALFGIKIETKSDGKGLVYATGFDRNDVTAGGSQEFFSIGYDSDGNFKGLTNVNWKFTSTGNQGSVIGTIGGGPSNFTILNASMVFNTDSIEADDGASHTANTGTLQIGADVLSANALTGGKELALGNNTACVLMNNQTVRCWGLGRESNGEGLLGAADSMISQAMIPQKVQKSGGGNLTGVIKISLGYDFACALKSDNTVWCWGDGSMRRLGNGSQTDMKEATQVKISAGTYLTDATDIAAGYYHACVATLSNRVRCWGEGADGRLGLGNTTDQYYANEVLEAAALPLINVDTVTVGEKFSCALKTDNTVTCWGDGASYALGNNGTADKLYADTLVLDDQGGNLSNVIKIDSSAYSDHTCAMINDGTIKCWGEGGSGQQGDGSNADNAKAAVMKFDATTIYSNATDFSVGADYTCAVGKGQGATMCSGANIAKQLGDDTTSGTNFINKFVEGPGGNKITRVHSMAAGAGSYGNQFSCAIFAPSGNITCWGDGKYGKLGNFRDATNNGFVFNEVLGSNTQNFGAISNAAQVSVGETFVCYTTTGNKAQCFGNGTDGQLGNGIKPYQWVVPVNANPNSHVQDSGGTDITNVTEVSSGNMHGCARLSTNQVRCWGENGSNQLGNNSTADTDYAVVVYKDSGTTAVNDIVSISVGQEHACGVTTGAKVRCWGYGTYGRLGNGGTSNNAYANFVKVDAGTDLTNVSKVYAGNRYTCAVHTDGTASCWGYDGSGVRGDNSAANNNYASTKVLSSTGPDVELTGIVSMAVEDSHTVAVLSDGTARIWGGIVNTQKGAGHTAATIASESMYSNSTPSDATGIAEVALGRFSSCTRYTNGKVQCVGSGNRYQMGDNNVGTNQYLDSDVLKATLVPIANATQISNNGYATCVVTSAKKIRCWGFGTYILMPAGSQTVFKSWMTAPLIDKKAI
ncbi:MAG: hypothetical protein HOE90_10550 [Bacteriovoracaceae bacterium]|nr:hypothetical protein [Bacteriovoracaceae bacterium]